MKDQRTLSAARWAALIHQVRLKPPTAAESWNAFQDRIAAALKVRPGSLSIALLDLACDAARVLRYGQLKVFLPQRNSPANPAGGAVKPPDSFPSSEQVSPSTEPASPLASDSPGVAEAEDQHSQQTDAPPEVTEPRQGFPFPQDASSKIRERVYAPPRRGATPLRQIRCR